MTDASERRRNPDPRAVYGEMLELRVAARETLAASREATTRIEEIVERLEKLTDAHSGAILRPAVPASPIPPSKMDSTKKMTAILLAACIGATAIASLTLRQPQPEEPTVDGLAAIRAGEWVKAEHEFTKKGDQHRLAEVYLRQDRDADAMQVLDGLHDGRAEYLRAIAALKRGDEPAAKALFVIARDLGDERAPQYLEKLGG